MDGRIATAFSRPFSIRLGSLSEKMGGLTLRRLRALSGRPIARDRERNFSPASVDSNPDEVDRAAVNSP